MNIRFSQQYKIAIFYINFAYVCIQVDALFCFSCVSNSTSTRFSFYKNILYKNIEDEMGQKVKNILRICSSWTFAFIFIIIPYKIYWGG